MKIFLNVMSAVLLQNNAYWLPNSVTSMLLGRKNTKIAGTSSKHRDQRLNLWELTF